MEKHITYLFPSKSRPEKFFKCLDNIFDLSYSDRFLVIAVLDCDDLTMAGIDVAHRMFGYGHNLIPVWGNSKSKIHAINREVGMIGETDVVALHSDDFLFTKSGFDIDIREAEEHYSGLIPFSDGHVNEKLVTYPLMTIDYLRKFNYIYHPDYISVFSDNEQMEVAKKLGMYKFVDKNIMEHQHYRWGYEEPDELMKHNDSQEMYIKDRETFQRRTMLNFDLKW